MRLDVIREAPDRLARAVWTFRLLADYGLAVPELRLTDYSTQTRPTLRHRNWQVVAQYDSSRPQGGAFARFLLLSAVPWPADVVAEARQQVLAALVVVRGDEEETTDARGY